MSKKKTFRKQIADYFLNGNSSEGKEFKEIASEEKKSFNEYGVAGAKISGGYVYDEFLHQLMLERGRRTYREMRDNDATISAILFAIEMLIRAVDFFVEENKDTKGSAEAEDAAIFVDSVLFKDMEHTWDEFLSEVCSMLVYGWEYSEIVYKRRLGPDQKDLSKKSIYNDGMIGVRKLANRAQETLERWDIDEYGNIYGMWQCPPFGGTVRYIPFEKALLFRPHAKKGSPEGRSVLRGAYISWYRLKNIQTIESIAIERELNGLPVGRIPNSIINGDTKEAKLAKQAWEKALRDIKYNEQGGLLLPSDPWSDENGFTNMKMFDFSLMASEGHRAIDTNEVILRYQRDIARTVLADFMMLGSSNGGSFALSKDKSSLFVHAVEGWLNTITETMNRYLIPRLWEWNKLDAQYMPTLKSGRVAPVNLDELGKYVSDLAGSGMPLFPDEMLETELRNAADLPQKEGDAVVADGFQIEDEDI